MQNTITKKQHQVDAVRAWLSGSQKGADCSEQNDWLAVNNEMEGMRKEETEA
jgi:hypothetical protein